MQFYYAQIYTPLLTIASLFFSRSLKKVGLVHLLEITNDLGKLYHNVKLHPIPSYSLEFLYARFAWGIFPFLTTFFSNPFISRSVIVARNEGGTTKYTTENSINPNELVEKAAASRSRSPKKRQRTDDIGKEDSSHQNEYTAKRGSPSIPIIRMFHRQTKARP